jgi:hypothetical protein
MIYVIKFVWSRVHDLIMNWITRDVHLWVVDHEVVIRSWSWSDHDLDHESPIVDGYLVICLWSRSQTDHEEDRRALHVDDQQALLMGLGTRDSVTGCGWGASSDEEEMVVMTLEDRELRGKTLEVEWVTTLKRWVSYGRDLDFTHHLKDRVTKPSSGKTPDVIMIDPSTMTRWGY